MSSQDYRSGFLDEETLEHPLLEVAYEDPIVRITATYPATDGGCPETVEVQISDWRGLLPNVFTETVIDALARVPQNARATK